MFRWLLKYCFRECLWGCFQRRWQLQLRPGVRDKAPLWVSGPREEDLPSKWAGSRTKWPGSRTVAHANWLCTQKADRRRIFSLLALLFTSSLSLLEQYIFSSTCAWTSDSRFFSLRTVGLAPAASWGLSGLQPQTERAALSAYPVLRLPDLEPCYWLLSFSSLQMVYGGASLGNSMNQFSLIHSLLYIRLIGSVPLENPD